MERRKRRVRAWLGQERDKPSAIRIRRTLGTHFLRNLVKGSEWNALGRRSPLLSAAIMHRGSVERQWIFHEVWHDAVCWRALMEPARVVENWCAYLECQSGLFRGAQALRERLNTGRASSSNVKVLWCPIVPRFVHVTKFTGKVWEGMGGHERI